MKIISPDLPDAVQMSYSNAIKLNAWAIAAVAVAMFSRHWTKSPDLTGVTRALVALLPLLPVVLYVRAIWSWIRGLDELQRKLQLEAVCFATLGMLLIALAADLLRTAEFAALNFGWEGCFAITCFLWMVGQTLASRSYQ